MVAGPAGAGTGSKRRHMAVPALHLFQQHTCRSCSASPGTAVPVAVDKGSGQGWARRHPSHKTGACVLCMCARLDGMLLLSCLLVRACVSADD